MKKVEKVSIADISFTLDSDAYSSLKQYLDSLHAYYDKDPDGSEITRDIEARIAELILGEQVYTKVVPKSLIDTIIAQLGTPEEIDDDVEADGAPAWSLGVSEPTTTIPRRLHRSAEGRILGGVCSGMAKFFDISVAWIRIAFLFPIILRITMEPFHWYWLRHFFEGWSWVFFVTYVVLWIALPMARTPRQKLESRGERITPSSIRQNLQEGARTPDGKKAASVAAEIFTVFGRVLLFFVKFVMAVIGFALMIAALGIFVAMIVMLVNPLSVGFMALGGLTGMAILSPLLFSVLVLFCTMMPLFIMGWALLAAVFSWKTGRVFFGVTLGLWLAAMVFCTVVIATNARYLRHEFREGNVKIHHWGWSWDDDYDGEKFHGPGHGHGIFWNGREDGRHREWRDGNPNRREIREIRDAFDTDSTEVVDEAGRDSTRMEIRRIE